MSSYKLQIPVDEKHWYAVHCKFRCEKRLRNEFSTMGIEAYVPVQQKISKYASRKKTSEVALIPSHVFVRIAQDEYLNVVRHPFVFGFLNFSGVLSSIPPKEIDLMKRVVGENKNVQLDYSTYESGELVEIISGELTGLKGKLIGKDNQKFKVELESLGWGLVINVDLKNLLKVAITKKVA